MATSEENVTLKKWAASGEWKPTFLTMLRNSANIRLSCSEAGIARKTAYAHRETDPEFREQWDEALEDACDLLEATARIKALQGDSDLLKWLLTAHRRAVYGPHVKVDIMATVREEAQRVADEMGLPVDDLIRQVSAIMAGSSRGH